MAWRITVPPTGEPVTVAEVKARLRLTTSADDATIAQNITSARTYAEKLMNQSLVAKSYAAFYDRFPWVGACMVIPMPPLLSVQAIRYLDFNTQTILTWDPSEYVVSTVNVPGLVKPKPGLIYPATEPVPGAVEVDFTAGPDPNPSAPGQVAGLADVYEGIRQLAAHIYEHPEAVTSDGLKEIPLALRSFFGTSKVWLF